MTILQTELVNNAGNKFIDFGVVGACVIFLGLVVVLLVKYIKKKNQDEVDRLTKEADEKNTKCDILYTEIKNQQSEYSDKLTDLLIASNEMNNKVIIALDNSTAALNNNSQIINKILDKL